MPHAAALDVGGTKLAAAVVDEAGRILRRASRPTPRTGDAEILWAAVVDVLAEALGDVAVDRCGIGCGGPMSADGELVAPLHLPAWRGFPLRSRVEAMLGVPTAIENDAKAIALAEGWLGAAVGSRHYLGMVVSTGVGGGIVLDGRLLAGSAGHVGHVVGRGASVPVVRRDWARAALAVARRPSLWGSAARQSVVLARPGWWRRRPFLPVPDPAYLRFRMLTAYGDPGHPPTGEDLVAYLHWCREHPRAMQRSAAPR